MRLRTSASGSSGGSSDDPVRHPAPTTRSAGCETTIVCGTYPRNHNCPRDEGKTSASAKRSALGSRAGSGRMFTICCADTRNSCPALLTASCPNTFRHRFIRTSWRPCESRRTHPPSDLTNRCHEEGGRSGSTHRGIRRFRKRVLEAYEERCAVCEYDIRFGDRLLGLEAAHIRWHSHDGRDVVSNGLALCGVHHKALDLGAMGLEGWGGGFRVLVSGRVRGRSPAARRLVGLRGRGIRPPVTAADAPDRRFVEWHRVEVFRG